MPTTPQHQYKCSSTGLLELNSILELFLWLGDSLLEKSSVSVV